MPMLDFEDEFLAEYDDVDFDDVDDEDLLDAFNYDEQDDLAMTVEW